MSAEVLLNFHGVGDPHAGVEADERPYWISEDFFDRIVALADSRRDVPVGFTFDDGNRSDLTIAAPRLARSGRAGAFFVLAGRIGAEHYLSDADIRALRDMGMQVGLHGADHVDWRRCSPDKLAHETVAARQRIADSLDRPVTEVAIPFGAYNAGVIRHLKQLGFARIHTSDGGWTDSRARIAARTSIRADMTIADVEAILDRREPLKRRARRWVSTRLRRHFI